AWRRGVSSAVAGLEAFGHAAQLDGRRCFGHGNHPFRKSVVREALRTVGRGGRAHQACASCGSNARSSLSARSAHTVFAGSDGYRAAMSWPGKRPHLRFATQALLVQVAVLVLILGVGFTLVAILLRAELMRQYEERALGVARSVAADDVIVRDVAAHERTS